MAYSINAYQILCLHVTSEEAAVRVVKGESVSRRLYLSKKKEWMTEITFARFEKKYYMSLNKMVCSFFKAKKKQTNSLRSIIYVMSAMQTVNFHLFVISIF